MGVKRLLRKNHAINAKHAKKRNHHHGHNNGHLRKRKHHRKRSKDDLDLNFKARNISCLDYLKKHNIIMDIEPNNMRTLAPLPLSRRFDMNATAIPAVSELAETNTVIIHKSEPNTPQPIGHLKPYHREDNKQNSIHNMEMEMDSNDDSDVDSADEDQIASPLLSFQNKDRPRLSIPTLMPTMDQSMTSPTNWYLNGMSKSSAVRSISPDQSIGTPNGGAAVMVTPKKMDEEEFGRNGIPKMFPQTVDPSQLFGMVSEYTDSGPKNYKDPVQSSLYPHRTYNIKKKTKKVKRKLPLYITHKKRKSRTAAKRTAKKAEIQHVKSW